MLNMRMTSPENLTERIGPSRRATRGLRAAAALVASAALVGGLSACGVKDAAAGVSAQGAGTAVTQIPVGDPFGPAKWSVTQTNEHFLVTPDRLIGVSDYDKTITAWDENGKKVWEQPANSGKIQFHTKTVSVVNNITDPKADVYTYRVTQFSNEDGKVVATNEVDTASNLNDVTIPLLYRGTPTFRQTDGKWVYFSQDGVKHTTTYVRIVLMELAAEDSPSGESRYTPDSPTGRRVSVNGWTSDALGFGAEDSPTLKTYDEAQGLVLVGDASSTAVSAMMVDAVTGARLYTVECSNGTGGYKADTPAKNSPNGQYGATNGLVFTRKQSTCLKNIKPSAVDDKGTVYSQDGDKLQMTSFDGTTTSSVLPLGAEPPKGFMKNGLAIHWNRTTNTITANPLKNN